MNTTFAKLSAACILSIGMLGCYTQVATNPDEEDRRWSREDRMYEQSADTTYEQDDDVAYDDDARRSALIGFRYYSPVWQTRIVYADPWWPSVSFGYYYDSWGLCGTPVFYHPYYYSYWNRPYWGHHYYYGWDSWYSGYATYGVNQPRPYTPRNSGVRRVDAVGRYDYSTGNSIREEASQLPAAGRSAGSAVSGSSSGRSASVSTGRRGIESGSSSGGSAPTGASSSRSSGGRRVETRSGRNSGSSFEGIIRQILTPRSNGESSGRRESNSGRSESSSSRPSYTPSAPPASSSGSESSGRSGSSNSGSSGGSRESGRRR